MAIDPQIKQAIYDCVQAANQSKTLSVKLVKWLENSMEGIEDPLDKSSYETHLDLIFDVMEIKEEEDID